MSEEQIIQIGHGLIASISNLSNPASTDLSSTHQPTLENLKSFIQNCISLAVTDTLLHNAANKSEEEEEEEATTTQTHQQSPKNHTQEAETEAESLASHLSNAQDEIAFLRERLTHQIQTQKTQHKAACKEASTSARTIASLQARLNATRSEHIEELDEKNAELAEAGKEIAYLRYHLDKQVKLRKIDEGASEMRKGEMRFLRERLAKEEKAREEAERVYAAAEDRNEGYQRFFEEWVEARDNAVEEELQAVEGMKERLFEWGVYTNVEERRKRKVDEDEQQEQNKRCRWA